MRLVLLFIGIVLALGLLPAAGGAQGVDVTAPGVVCDSPDGLWHAVDATIACTASDSETGLANPADASFVLGTFVPSGEETANASTESYEVCDVAGNCVTVGPLGGNKVDRKAPTDPTTVRSTDHKVRRWSRDRRIDMYWTGASDGGSRLDGFSYSWSHFASSLPNDTKDTEQGDHRATSPRLSTGKWWFHIRTVDNVGNWTSTAHRGPYFIDITRPGVRALSGSGKVGRTMNLRYRTTDNTHRTRERITVSRGGSVVRSWSRDMGRAFWDNVQSVSWTPRAAGSYSFCVRAWDPAGNSRRDCAGVSVTRPSPNCSDAYPTVCIPPPPPDLDCSDIPYRNFAVRSPDPHGFDGDRDGVGCET
jgi:hypothetical protein